MRPRSHFRSLSCAPSISTILVAAGTRIVGTGGIATAERISQVRQNRLLGTTAAYDSQDYVDRATITEELAYARQICNRHGWPMIDVTRRSIEETAATIIKMLNDRKNRPLDAETDDG